MKLKKSEICVLTVTLLFLALTLGYQLGRSRSPADFSVRTLPEPAAEPAESNGSVRTFPMADEPAVNINTAGQDELCTLPGIGEVLAERIIAYREENGSFSRVEDITKVTGIGSSTFEKLRGQITVD